MFFSLRRQNWALQKTFVQTDERFARARALFTWIDSTLGVEKAASYLSFYKVCGHNGKSRSKSVVSRFTPTDSVFTKKYARLLETDRDYELQSHYPDFFFFNVKDFLSQTRKLNYWLQLSPLLLSVNH